MSAANPLPILTPSLLTVGKEQSVVVEFPRDLPRDVLITFDFYYENTFKKLATVPTVILGPRAVKANFSEFPKPGEVEVVIKIAHEESTLFPKFKVHVQSPIEAIFHGIPLAPRGSNQAAILSSILTYLMHSEDELKDKHMRSHADVILCNILQALPEIAHIDWKLSTFLCGSYGVEENLLHFCIRRKLAGMAEFLLQPKLIAGRAQLLQCKALDGKTPAELARKSGMKRVLEMVEKSLNDPGEAADMHSRTFTVSTDYLQSRKKVKGNRGRSNTHLDGNSQDVGPLPLFIPKQQRVKKKKGVAKRIKSVFKGDNKDKNTVVISSPYPPPPVEFDDFVTEGGGTDELDRPSTPDSPLPSLPLSSLPKELEGFTSHSSSRLESATYLRVASDLKEETRRSWPRADSPTTGFRRDSMEGLNGGFSTFIPTPESPTTSLTTHKPHGRSSMYTPGGTPGSLSPPEAYNARRSSLPPGQTATITNALIELKNRSLYTAKVTRYYRWASSPHRSISLREGDVVYVTQELDGDTCLGVCNDCYGKFPKAILSRLNSEEREGLHTADDYQDSDSDMYDEVDDLRAIYSVPRNVPLLSSSDSDSDHTYDVPSQHHDLWRLHPNLRNLPENYYRVPRRYKVPTMKPQLSNPAQSPEIGRLLSHYHTSSSHDTGLDRLGISTATPHTEDTVEATKVTVIARSATLNEDNSPHGGQVVQKSPSLPRSMKLESPLLLRRMKLAAHSDPLLLDVVDSEDDLKRWDSSEITELRLSSDKSNSNEETDSDIYDDLVSVTKRAGTDDKGLEEHEALDGTGERSPTGSPQPDMPGSITATDEPISTSSKESDKTRELDSTESHPPPLGPKPKQSTGKAECEQMPTAERGTVDKSGNTGSESPVLVPKTKPSTSPAVIEESPYTNERGSGTNTQRPLVGPKPDSTAVTSDLPATDIRSPALPPKPKPRRTLQVTKSFPLASPIPTLPERSQTMRDSSSSTHRMDSYPPAISDKPVPTVRKGYSERRTASPLLSKKPAPPPVSPKPVRKFDPTQ